MNQLALNYLTLRKAVGALGMSMPFTLALGGLLLGVGLQDSISAYWHTAMRDVLTGNLAAISMFLLAYHGYSREDSITAKVAGAAAVGVSWFHVDKDGGGVLHMLCAAVFFLALAHFCLNLFTKSAGPMTDAKINRNVVYRACGYTILVCLAALVAVGLFTDGSPLTFWLESIAVLAFGVSWLTKGRAILKDEA